MAANEGVDGGFKFCVIESLWEGFFDRSFAVVLDSHAVAESFQEILLTFHEVDLEEVLSDGVAGAEL